MKNKKSVSASRKGFNNLFSKRSLKVCEHNNEGNLKADEYN